MAKTGIELVTIGDELLLGQTIDTNAAFLSEQLAAAGLMVTRRTTVGDDAASITTAVRDALARARIVITTGGLGPTRDDFTKSVISQMYGRELVIDEYYLEKYRQRWAQRGMEMPASNRTQAEHPAGSHILKNRLGSAQGIVLDDESLGMTIMLPGVPHELRNMTVESVIPYVLEQITDRAHPIMWRTLRVTSIPESLLAERINHVVDDIAPLGVAFLPNFAGVDLRITSWGAFSADIALSLFDEAERKVREVLGRSVYGTGNDDLAAVVGELLRTEKLTLSVAESCTGGMLGARITAVAGSSDYFIGGFLTYANDAKVELVGVRPQTLQASGAVSEEVVREMAMGARDRTGAEVSIAISGIAGPEGGSADKPVGLVWTAVAVRDVVKAKKFIFPGDRDEVRQRAAQFGLALLYEMLA